MFSTSLFSLQICRLLLNCLFVKTEETNSRTKFQAVQLPQTNKNATTHRFCAPWMMARCLIIFLTVRKIKKLCFSSQPNPARAQMCLSRCVLWEKTIPEPKTMTKSYSENKMSKIQFTKIETYNTSSLQPLKKIRRGALTTNNHPSPQTRQRQWLNNLKT